MESDLPQVGENGPAAANPSHDFIEAVSPSMRSLVAVMQEVAQSEVPVLLLSEKGAGKKATAQRIHELSRRRGQRFRVLSCITMETGKGPDLAGEDTLVGEGTIFLEELSELSAQAQSRLLQAMTGGNTNGGRAQRIARLICGSACDLEAEVKAGRFREDLYYRISGVCLRIPPLRQRREDIPSLMEHFLCRFGRDFQRMVPILSKETRRLFQEYSWPGNVRELENAAKAIVALGDETVAMGGLRAMLCRSSAGVSGQVSLKQAARAASRETEKELILRALTRTHWNRRRAAQDLQISYKALLYKLKQMGCSEQRAS